MSPLLFAFQAAKKSGVLLRGAVAALSALPRVSPECGRAGWGAAVAATARLPGGGAGTGHQQPVAAGRSARGSAAERAQGTTAARTGNGAAAARSAAPRPGSTRRAAHRAGQRRERHTPRQTRLEPLIGARASARARRDRLDCRTPPRAFVERPSRPGARSGTCRSGTCRPGSQNFIFPGF